LIFNDVEYISIKEIYWS